MAHPPILKQYCDNTPIPVFSAMSAVRAADISSSSVQMSGGFAKDLNFFVCECFVLPLVLLSADWGKTSGKNRES